MDWFRRTAGSVQAAWSEFPVSYRVLTGALLVLLAFAGAWAVSGAGNEIWVRIADRDQTIDQRGRIADKLREIGLRFKVDGDSVSVLEDQADEAMLQLHSSGTLGDEAFFKFLKETDLFGTREKSDRQWLVGRQRRLAAIIQGLDFVREAQVQIAEPEDARKLWWSNGREATAAVIIELEPGERMNSSRVRGMASVVCAAVPNLKPSSVKILDQSGRFFQVDEHDFFGSQDLRDQELSRAATIEEKVRIVLPPDSRVSAQVRLKAEKWETTTPNEKRSGGGAETAFISVAVIIPDTEAPAEDPARQEFVNETRTSVRAAAGATDADLISIRIAPIASVRVTGFDPAPPPPPEPWIRDRGPMIGLVVLGCAVLAAAFRLVRGLGPPPDGGVIAEESLRAPGESILSAQDEALDRIRNGVRESVQRNPREAADVARRWMAP